jgi:hypothetical protein
LGNIQGIVRDAVTGFAIVGARVSMSIPGASGVSTVTTGASGQYSFANVPASLWSDGIVAADGIVQFGELSAYTVTVDLAAVNAGLPSNVEPYPGQAFADAVVGFSSFQDGNNALICAGTAPALTNCTVTEGGSGANTPVSGLTTTLNFIIGRLTETIQGKVFDAQNNRPISGATVTLLDASVPLATPAPFPAAGPLANGIRLSLTNAPVTTASDGSFSFTRVPASHAFNVEASFTGYVSSGTLTAGTGPVATLGGGLVVRIPATPAFIGAGLPLLGAPGAGELLMAPAVPGSDAVAPYVVRVDPADGADIDVTSSGNPKRPIVFTFSECMQADNSFTKVTVATVDFKGRPIPPGGVSGGDGSVEVTSAWSTSSGSTCPSAPASGNVLTITPVSNWQAGVTYGAFVSLVGVAPVPPLTPTASLVDVAGNPCCRCIPLNVLGSASAASATVAQCSGVPGASPVGAVLGEAGPTPGTLLFTTNGGPGVLDGPAASLGANSADFNTSTATITWPAVTGARAYEVFMSIDGGDWQLIARTLPGNNPVTSLLSRSWSFDDALNATTPGTVGVNPGAPTVSVTNPTPRVSPGFESFVRRVVEGFIRDAGDDVSAAFGLGPPSGGTVDSADTFADLSDGFGVSTSPVRIAIATENTNGIAGTLGTPVTIKDNTGPQTNGAAPAGSTPLPVCTFAAPCATAVAANPTATTWRGAVLQDLFTGTTFAPDGVADTILIGLSEPLSAATATCNINASPAVACTQYQLKAIDGSTPARLSAAAITIVSATYDEDTNGNGILDPGEDTNGNGILDTGSNVDRATDTIKGNNFGNAFVWLRIAPVSTGGTVDIRTGDYVAITGVQDLAGNTIRPVDPTLPQNQFADITRPQVGTASATNGSATTDTIAVTFSEPLGVFALGVVRIAGVDCVAAGAVTVSPAFRVGDSSVTLSLNSAVNPSCDVALLSGDGTASSDVLAFGATTADLAGNTLLPARNAFIFSGTFPTGTFGITSTTAIAALPADTTAPQLSSVTTGTANTVVLNANERLGGVVSAANVVVTTANRANACTFGNGGITGATFVIGATKITLTLSGSATCSVSAMVANDVVSAGPPGVAGAFLRDVAGNALDTNFDTAVLQADGTFKVQATP